MTTVTDGPDLAAPTPFPTTSTLTVDLHGVDRWFAEHPRPDPARPAVPEGAITVLLGPNGAGKTTAIRMITGALAPDAGTVRTFGLDPITDGEEVRRRCGVVSAKPALYDRLSGRGNLEYAAELYGLGRHADDRILVAADRFGIVDALEQKVGGYSTGMKTRLALARSVLHDPELLLYDEPTSGLDPESSHAVLELIREMTAEGRTVVMCTHLLVEAEGLADRIVVLDAGTDLLTGSQEELTRLYWPPNLVHLGAESPGLLGRLAKWDGVLAMESTVRGPTRRRCRSSSTTRPASPTSSAAWSPRACASPASSPTSRRSRTSTSRCAATTVERRQAARAPGPGAGAPPDRPRRPRRGGGDPMSATIAPAPRPRAGAGAMNWARMFTVTRTELRQLYESKDFWVPMVILGSFFFLIVPAILLLGHHQHRQRRRHPAGVGRARSCCPAAPATRCPRASTRPPRSATCSPCTSSPRSPWSCRSPSPPPSARRASSASASAAPASSSPTPPPTSARSTSASSSPASCPGYLTTIVGFGIYSLVVNLLVGRKVGGWFFPTASWWLLILWVLPPFMAIALSLVLRLSARVKSTAAAQQAAGLVTFPLIIIAYGQSTGALLGSGAPILAFGIGLVAWIIAFALLAHRLPVAHPRAPPRRRRRTLS